MIKHLAHKYILMSKNGDKKLGESTSLEGIEHREKQVQYFKNLHQFLKDHGSLKGFPHSKEGK